MRWVTVVFSDAHFDCASSGATLAALPLSWPELFAKDPLLVFAPQFWWHVRGEQFSWHTSLGILIAHPAVSKEMLPAIASQMCAQNSERALGPTVLRSSGVKSGDLCGGGPFARGATLVRRRTGAAAARCGSDRRARRL